MKTYLYERTEDDIAFDIQYAYRYTLLMKRFYRRLGGLFLFIEIVAGSSAFFAWMCNEPQISGISGVLVAITAALNIVISPGEKKAVLENQRREWLVLQNKVASLPVDEIECEILKLRQNEGPEIESLRNPAYNDVLRECGRDSGIVKLGPLEWLFAKIS